MYYIELKLGAKTNITQAATLFTTAEKVFFPEVNGTHMAFETEGAALAAINGLAQKMDELIEKSDRNCGFQSHTRRRIVTQPYGADMEFYFYGWTKLAEWHVVEHQATPCRLRIAFRTNGVRYTYVFDRISDFFACVNKKDSGELLTDKSQILLVEDEGNLIYTSFPPRAARVSVKLDDIKAWFTETA